MNVLQLEEGCRIRIKGEGHRCQQRVIDCSEQSVLVPCRRFHKGRILWTCLLRQVYLGGRWEADCGYDGDEAEGTHYDIDTRKRSLCDFEQSGLLCVLVFIPEKRFDESFVLKESMQLDNKLIPKGYAISSIQGILLPGISFIGIFSVDAFCNMVFDLLYMVKMQPLVTLTFSPSIPSIEARPIRIPYLDCYVFLMEYFEVLQNQSKSANLAALRNHYISVTTLLKANSFIPLPSLLSPQSVEQVLVVYHLLDKWLRSQFPKPILFAFLETITFSSKFFIDRNDFSRDSVRMSHLCHR